jgi:leucyl aminopeptidase
MGMRVTSSPQPFEGREVEALVVGVYGGEGAMEFATWADLAEAFPAPLREMLERWKQQGEFTGKPAEIFRVPAPPGLPVRHLILAGLGPRDALQTDVVTRAVGSASKSLAEKERGAVVFDIGGGWRDELLEEAVAAAVVGCHGQDLYRREKKLFPLGEICWRTESAEVVRRGASLGESINLARRLVNEPPNQIYPAAFTRVAEEVCGREGIELTIWDRERLEREQCGALLGVAQGSEKPPYLLLMRYRGGPEQQAPLALVGKGVTFDSGGYSLKPSDGMKTMKCDMAGAATVLGAMQAIARWQLPVNVIGLVGLVENLVSGSAFKVGDVLTARSGKTIEVLNTDAEGRLVLADVLDVACDHQPGALIDLATLTGACVVALGTNVTGMMTNHADWSRRVAEAARIRGEPLWELPMFDEFGEQIRSTVADIKNVGEGRWGGAITAAKFLEEFVRKMPWVHLDIAGPAFLESPRSWMDAGGSGAMVRTLVEVARSWDGSPEPREVGGRVG